MSRISRRRFLQLSAAAAAGASALPALAAQAQTPTPPPPADKDQLQGGGEVIIARPTDPPDPEDPPNPGPPPILMSVTPSEGLLTGGATVTLAGARFVPDTEVYFGATPSALVTFIDPNTLQAQVPPAEVAGPVHVMVVNPNGRSATLQNGFNYIAVDQAGCARITEVTPELVLEGVISDVVLRGRNLITAYNQGLIALRASERASYQIVGVQMRYDPPTDTDVVTLSVQINVSPGLEPNERLVIQVIASCRAGARNDLIVETSRGMFTVVPGDAPVPLAYTANVLPGRDNLLVIAGKNLKGCYLDFSEVAPGATDHYAFNDDEIVVAAVAVPDAQSLNPAGVLRLRNEKGAEIGALTMRLSEAVPASANGEPPVEEPLALSLEAVPGQQLVSITENNARVFDLAAGAFLSSTFTISFPIQIVNITYILPLVRLVKLIPFFDDGDGEPGEGEPLGIVGRLLRLRATGLLIALRVEIQVHITIVVIITYIPYFTFNEFPDLFPSAFGTILISVYILIEIILIVSFLLALALPDGSLRVLFTFLLVINIDFSLTANNREIVFGTNTRYRVNWRSILPFAPFSGCGNNVQIASDGGQVAFAEPTGTQAFYFPTQAGECCLTWKFDFDLIRFAPGQPDTVVQGTFQTSYCMSFAEAPRYLRIRVTSEPPPTGLPPTLRMQIGDLANLFAKGQYVSRNGTPQGAEFDLEQQGIEVYFVLGFGPVVLDPLSLETDQAFAIQDGENAIYASLTAPAGGEAAWTFFPEDVSGFDIIAALAEGRPPRVRNVVPLPVKVETTQATILAGFVHDEDVDIPLRRNDPNFVLASPTPLVLKLRLIGVQDEQQIKVRVGEASFLEPPLKTLFGDHRHDAIQPDRFFTGNILVEGTEQIVEVNPKEGNEQTFLLDQLTLVANAQESWNAATPTASQLVPIVNTRLYVKLDITNAQNNAVRVVQAPSEKEPSILIKNEESYEEYYRVTHEAQEILAASTLSVGIAPFVQQLAQLIRQLNPTLIDFLQNSGRSFWNQAAIEASLSPAPSDLPLYYARLRCVAAITNLITVGFPGAEPELYVEKFERQSRGEYLGGGNPLAHNVLLVGFDPWVPTVRRDPIITTNTLHREPARTRNPSGLAALVLSRLGMANPNAAKQPVMINGIPTVFYAFIAPLRFRDMEDGGQMDKWLEEITESEGSPFLSMIVTLGENESAYYELARFAGRYRGKKKRDNENWDGQPEVPTPPFLAFGLDEQTGTLTNPPAPLPPYLESLLPYRRVVTSPSQTLPGPFTDLPFTLNQSYIVRALIAPNGPERSREVPRFPPDPPIPRRFRREPVPPEADTYVPIQGTNLPSTTEPAGEGSAGGFVENELFARMAILRETDLLELTERRIPSGHISLPSIDLRLISGTITRGNARTVIDSTQTILTALVQALGLEAVPEVNFGLIPVGGSRTITVRSVNRAPFSLLVTEVAADPPFSVETPSPLPVTVNVNGELVLEVTFSPEMPGPVTSEVVVRNGPNELLRFRVRGSGRFVRQQDP